MLVSKKMFTEGMILDSLESLSPNNSYRLALNAIHKSRDSLNVLVNEESNSLCSKFSGKIVGASYIDERNQTLIFTDSDELHLFDHKTCTSKFVVSAEEFGCEWNLGDCEHHYAEFKVMQPCNELHAYFSSKCEYYVVNIDEMCDPKRKEAIKGCFKETEDANSCEYSCDYFKLFKCVCTPKIVAIPSKSGGHGMVAGAYQFAVQLEDNDGNSTNWSFISEPINLGSKNNIGGEISDGSINIDISCLDCRYDKVRIAAIRTVNQVTTAEVIATRHYNSKGIDFTYYGQEGEAIALEEVVNKRRTFIEGQDLIQHDSRLWLYNTKQVKNLHYQPKAWLADLKLVEYEVTAPQQKKYQYKSLMRGEGYIFAIVWKYCDGTYSAAFPLSASPSNTDTTGFQARSAASQAATSNSNNSSNSDINELVLSEEGELCRVRGNYDPVEMEEDTSDFVLDNVSAWDTDLADLENATKCDLCGSIVGSAGCCVESEDDDGNTFTEFVPANTEELGGSCEGCDEDTEAIASDGPNAENIATSVLDDLAKLGYDPETNNTPPYECHEGGSGEPSATSSLKSASEQLLNYAVTQAERKVRKAQELQGGTKTQISPSGGEEVAVPLNNGTSTQARNSGEGNSDCDNINEGKETTFGHKYVDCCGIHAVEEAPRVIAKHDFITDYSCERYPDTKDCDGGNLWGEKSGRQVEIAVVPDACDIPLIVSGDDGVPSPLTPTNDPINNTYIRLLGLEVSNIQFPTEEELPKPLCPTNPYKIVMAPRDRINRRIQAKGIATSTFLGDVRGETYAFPRHGVNAWPNLDRYVDNNGDHRGTDGGTIYNFHSLDTNIQGFGLSADIIRPELFKYGNGWRYGLQEEGEEPEDTFNGSRCDQLGARQFINLNKESAADCQDREITGLTYAEADTVVRNPSGIDHPLSNLHRESSVFLQSTTALPDLPYAHSGQTDKSFIPDGLVHSCPINRASTWYVSLRRDIPDQYGSVEAMRFVDLGLYGNKNAGNRVHGPVGDIYIGPHSFRRTGYVSNKVGNQHNTSKGLKTICETPDDPIFQQVGQWYSTKLPEALDRSDAKNFANPLPGLNCEQASNATSLQNDFYYHKVQNTLINYFGEFEVNPWMRATTPGDSIKHGEVHYPMLQDLELDSSFPRDTPIEEAFIAKGINAVQCQPSLKKRLLKSLIRIILDIILPAMGISQLTDLEGVMDTTGFIYGLPMLVTLWWLANKVLLNETKLDELLGIPTCKTDEEGGHLDEKVKNFQDNTYSYNFDYSMQNDKNLHFSMNSTYSTCSCDDCLADETENRIYFSNKQMIGSQIDSYKNFKANNFQDVDAGWGKLQKLFTFNDKFYAHTSDGLSVIQTRSLQIPTNLGQALIAKDVQIQPYRLLDGAVEGFAGTIDPNASIVTKYGYFFLDREARKIYQFDGTGLPKEISTAGMSMFFKDKIEFCPCTEDNCVDEGFVDQAPFYRLGWDPRYDRLLVTKRDSEECNSWTLSYDPFTNQGAGSWISFHSYLPDNYFHDRSEMYSIKGGGIWKHNTPCSYQTYYGTYYPHMIETTVVPQKQNESMKSFIYSFNNLRTEAEKCVTSTCSYIKDLDKTFNKLAVWNSTQGSGTLILDPVSDNRGKEENQHELILEKGKIIKIDKTMREWNFNELHDNRAIDCSDKPMTVCKSSCQPIYDINEGIFDCSPPNDKRFQGRNLEDDHLTYRFTLDSGDSSLRLKTIYLETHDIHEEDATL